MDSFLSQLEEQRAPRATRLVQFINKNGNSVQENCDEGDEITDAPAHCTKLNLYRQFIAERGWKYVYNQKNRIIDKVPIKGIEQEPTNPSLLPSIKTFMLYWQRNYPHMKIQKASVDICDECFIFVNQVRYKERATGKDGRGALLDEFEVDFIPLSAVKDCKFYGLRAELIIFAAAKHVQNQKKQQELFNKLKRHV
jgi:hypothetical protein